MGACARVPRERLRALEPAPGPRLRIGKHLLERRDDVVDVARVEQARGISGDLRERCHVRARDRTAARHRLEHRHPESLVQRRESERCGAAVELHERVTRDAPTRLDARRQRPVVALAGEDEPQVRPVCPEPREGSEEPGVVLVPPRPRGVEQPMALDQRLTRVPGDRDHEARAADRPVVDGLAVRELRTAEELRELLVLEVDDRRRGRR